ncbi:Uncharacterised protein [Mycobacteroides abscessus subsp. abscessus]|nr:Uncharacterised protein [Mycobacteroides abscessus subsp. abscessus]
MNTGSPGIEACRAWVSAYESSSGRNSVSASSQNSRQVSSSLVGTSSG